MNNKISEVMRNELLHKVEVTEGLQQVMMGSLRILDNLSRTPDEEETAKKLQEEINILLEDMLK
jgi:hypothetical protein